MCGAFQPTLDGVADYTDHLASRLRATDVAGAVSDCRDHPRVPDPQLSHEHTVLSVPPGDPCALEAAIARQLADPDLTERLGTGGRLIGQQHNWGTVTEQHKSLYQTVLEERPVGTGRGA